MDEFRPVSRENRRLERIAAVLISLMLLIVAAAAVLTSAAIDDFTHGATNHDFNGGASDRVTVVEEVLS